MNALNAVNSFDKTDREYTVAPTDDLVIFWRSKLEKSRSQQSCRGGEGIHLDAGVSTSIFYSLTLLIG